MDKKIVLILVFIAVFLLLAGILGGVIYLNIMKNDKDIETQQNNKVEEDNAFDEETDTNNSENTQEDENNEANNLEDLNTVYMKVWMFDFNKYNAPNQSDYLTEVTRTTARQDVATFGCEEIIKGPTAEEITQGLQPTFGDGNHVNFTSNSNCNGKDFTISIENKKTTFKFCRQTQLAGDFSGGIVTEQITKTIKQFPTVDQVRVLTVNGDCLNDLSGLNQDQCWY